MRMWHKDLISVLPDKQLLSQWRECCAISSNIMGKGTPNHILVNKVLQYNKSHFYNYCCIVTHEMFIRGFDISKKSREKIFDYVSDEERQVGSSITHEELYRDWHNNRYLLQCFYNLQEKYDCGGISEEDYIRIFDLVYEKVREDLSIIIQR